MSERPRWGYVQARLQARHGERLQEVDWRAIEAARSTDQFIERARASPLRRFTERMQARMSSHAIERILRETWRSYVAELSGWVPDEWGQAVLWAAVVPELPISDAVLRGKAPGWAEQDPAFAEFAKTDGQKHKAAPANAALAALDALPGRERTLGARWYAHWRSLLPRHHAQDRGLLALSAAIKTHIERLDRAGPHETSAPYRLDLARKVTRVFRRQAGSPAAVFCHLALVALDLERLRGDLLRRRLFEPAIAEAAA